ncbi:MAG: Geranyl transferase [Steroidobacteraceae bacterium]|nr:Geranyl transferase [Steroidobacteraceae bacterium]MBM2853916.1 Geranyl transferase [Steroidobacteraceae bacterium]
MSVEAATTISWQSQYRERVEGVLERFLPGSDSPPARLHQAMRYAALGPGKRIRPVLVYATGVAVGLPPAALDGPAAAVELIHAYSLVHDDLPSMDDDDLRRGRPTTHRAFDEATAILAGDALQVLAFEILADDSSLSVDPAQRLEMIRTLAHASGTQGMAGGQAMDLAAVGRRLERDQIEEMHTRKTGALIRAAVLIAAGAAPSLSAPRYQALDRYGTAVGLSFQIVDDLLDVLGDPALTGKAGGADAQRAKPTYPAIVGIAAARERAAELAREGIEALAGFGAEAGQLREFAAELAERSR